MTDSAPWRCKAWERPPSFCAPPHQRKPPASTRRLHRREQLGPAHTTP